MNMLTIRILSVAAFLLLGPLVGGLLDGFDRKISARFQGRQGPPVLQPFYDLYKLFCKEPLMVNHVQIFFVIAFLVFLVFTGGLFFFGGDILLVFFALTLADIFLILAACSSNSPFSSMGAQRELVQNIACEPMLLLVAIGFYMSNGSFAVSDLVVSEFPSVLFMPAIFLGFLYILTIKFRKSPFDISTSHHAHQEMVKGTTTEFSGWVLALTELAHWYETVFLLGIIVLFFCYAGSLGWIIGLVVALFSWFLEIFIDNVYARMKWQVMLKSAWVVAMGLGVLNVLVLSYVR